MARNRLSGLVNREPGVAIAPRRPTRNQGPQRAWSPAIITVAVARWLRLWLPGWLTRRLREGIPPSIPDPGAGAGTGAGTGLPLPPLGSVGRAAVGHRRVHHPIPKEFAVFVFKPDGARPVHSRQRLGPPSLAIAVAGAQLGRRAGGGHTTTRAASSRVGHRWTSAEARAIALGRGGRARARGWQAR
jgi:hypothetical protein